jgi:uncharacterized damage-inducible protein DinB
MIDIAASGLSPALAVPFGLIENAHNRLTRRVHVHEMSQAELDFIGPGNRNSTGTLLAHIALTDYIYLLCIKGEPQPTEPHPILGSFDDQEYLAPVSGIPAADLLARHAMVVGMIREYLQSCTDAEAERAVKVWWWPEEATVRYVLWHMAGHCMQHIGQIERLKSQYRQG